MRRRTLALVLCEGSPSPAKVVNVEKVELNGSIQLGKVLATRKIRTGQEQLAFFLEIVHPADEVVYVEANCIASERLMLHLRTMRDCVRFHPMKQTVGGWFVQ